MSNGNLVTKLNLDDKFWITGVLRMNASCRAVVDLGDRSSSLYEFGASLADERVPESQGYTKRPVSKNKTKLKQKQNKKSEI